MVRKMIDRTEEEEKRGRSLRHWSSSIWANWLILAVILLRAVLKKAPKRAICILWAVVAIRLLLPFSIESPVSQIPKTTVAFQEAVDTSLIHIEAVPFEIGIKLQKMPTFWMVK